MKTIRTRLIGLLLPLAVSVISSCQKEVYRIKSGDTIEFTIGTVGNVMTRTAYSGEESDGRERIDWRSGDILRIHCSQAATDDGKHYADYMVEKDGKDNGAISKTTINVVEGDFGLKWSDAESFTFNAVYPSPETGNEGDSFGTGGSATTLTGHIPSEQGCASVSKNGTLWTVAPDMKSQYMIATTTVANDGNADENINGNGNVFLNFYPLTTAIRFTIENGTARTGEAGDMYIDAVSVISAGTRISGGFTASLAGWNGDWNDDAEVPRCTATESGPVSDQEVKLDLSGKDVLLKDGDKLTFTLFLLPTQDQGVDDLSFKVYRHDKDGNRTWMSTRLAYNDAERTGVLFQKHKLTEVTGLLLPDGARWQVKYTPEIERWTAQDNGNVSPTPEIDPQPFITSWIKGLDVSKNMLKYNYSLALSGETNFNHTGTSEFTEGKSTLELTSFREYEHEKDDVVWFLEYLDETSGDWKVARAGGKMNGLVTLDVAGLSSGESVLGKGAQTINITVDAAEEPSTSKTHKQRLLDAAQKGTTDAPYDLSMYDIYGSPRIRAKTANCYIVKAQGCYAFPLVYGNAIDDNVAPAGYINVNAYNPGGEIDPTSDIMTRFRNYKGNGIRQPYLEADLETNCSSWTASVLWQDASFIDGCDVLTAAEAAAKELTSMTGEGLESNACGYVMFNVNSNIQQGNAVIAVKDNNDIIWSWHIWITDDELDMVSFTNYSGQDVNMLPVNLGWVDSDGSEAIKYYEGKSVKLRISQEGSNIIKEFTVTRRPETTASHVNGSSPYYQWGRKDPFRSGSISTATNSVSTDIAYSIKNPDKFVSGGAYYYNETLQSATAHYYNLWSALNKGLGTAASNYGSKTIKTIYDPCPPGFQIPHGIAFTGFTSTGTNSSNNVDFIVDGEFNTGWYFMTGAGNEKNFFKAGGYIGNSGTPDEQGNNGYYWTSVPQTGTGSDIQAIGMDFSATRIDVIDKTKQSNGCNIRPVREEYL